MKKIIVGIVAFLFFNTLFLLPHFAESKGETVFIHPIFEWMMFIGMIAWIFYTGWKLVEDLLE